MVGGSMNIFRASAPVRLDFAGAWTDVSPFAEREGGAVVNAAIKLHAHAEVLVGGERYYLHSKDLNEQQDFDAPKHFPRDGRLDLLKAALRETDPGPCRLTTWSDVPLGSGLGTSGALDVALAAVLAAARGEFRAPIELAEDGYRIEAVDAEIPGGRQDQYAAACGGFHRFGFGANGVDITPLAIDPAFADELAAHMIICYTGQSRVSGSTIARVIAAYERGDPPVVDALRALAGMADRMAEALLAADLARVGQLLSANWQQQLRLDARMRSPEMARLEAAMTAAGALGGKAAGAGAGGSMFFVVPDLARAAAAATECGAQVLPLQWASEGIVVE
jgi:D-glycero-alpha-D-manno-heptose-7-phosphate kinase